MVVAGITVNDVQIFNRIEMVLGSISRIDTGHTWVETASQNSRQTSLLETLAVSPLPRILEMSLVLGLVVGCVQITATASQTSLHNGEVLVG